MAQVKEKKKSKGKKALMIVLGVVAAIVLAAAVFINVTTLPQKEDKEHKYIVGGMIYSDTVEYKSDSARSIRHNPVVRIMQMVWRFCQNGDEAKHAEQTPPSDVVKNTDIQYIDDGNMFHRLDVYFPDGRDDVRQLPVIVDIHGGGWMYGDKNLNEYYCLELAHKGYVVFNVSYRLVPDVTVPEQIQDCLAALTYINDNYKAYTDNDTLILTGDSAGGMLAAYTAAIMGSSELQNAFNAPYYENGIQPSALILTSPVAFMKDAGTFGAYTSVMWGDSQNTEPYKDLMDLDKILEKSTLPPTYLITSDGDALAHDQTHRAYELLQEKGIKSEIVNYGDGEDGKPLQHVFSVLSPFDTDGQKAIDGALEFVKENTDK
jgi:acetyl esterase/lipase